MSYQSNKQKYCKLILPTVKSSFQIILCTHTICMSVYLLSLHSIPETSSPTAISDPPKSTCPLTDNDRSLSQNSINVPKQLLKLLSWTIFSHILMLETLYGILWQTVKREMFLELIEKVHIAEIHCWPVGAELTLKSQKMLYHKGYWHGPLSYTSTECYDCHLI